jgi:hypothetical protein
MITCFLEYRIDPKKIAEFERYGRMWMELIARFGGTHHGYFLPGEGHSHTALALFSFPSFADYEAYRTAAATDGEVQAAVRYMDETGCVQSWDRRFFRPVLPGAGAA